MKIYFLTIILACIFTNNFAQAPQGIPYQSALRNSNGSILANQAVSLRFSIHDSVVSGNIVFQETHAVTTNAQGIVNVNIGLGAAVVDNLAAVDWGSNAKFLQIEMNISGGSTYTDLGTQQMMSVPFALYASNGLPDGNAGDILFNNGIYWVGIPVGTPGQVLQLNTSNIPTWASIGSSGLSLPTVATTAMTFIGVSTATCGGNVISDGGATVAARGVCWSTTPNPTIANNISNDGGGTGTFISNLTGLSYMTTYYVRAYATNGLGTTYGNQVSFMTSSTPPTIGQSYQGGIIAYILQPGDPGYIVGETHGLIAAPVDQSSYVYWHEFNAGLTGATGTSIGTGNANTNLIVAFYGLENNAARLCFDLVVNGYSDWYLPSRDELNKLYINRIAIGANLAADYWSSSEYAFGETVAWYQSFNNNFYGTSNKSNTASIRAVRSF